MPSASTAKLEKQASSEAVDPIKQGIVFVDHKIRNLMKKKGRLDAYKDEQKNGKTLIDDQVQALKKYDELCQNLLFAQELKKQLNTIQDDNAKVLKKKEKKEAYEREQQEVAKVKEILIIQDVLASMGTDTVREDFLAGRNRAVQLTETELQYLDELFVEVSPKREPEEGQPSFLEQAQNGAKHLLGIVEGKDKEVIGTKYSVLRDLINKIHNSGYFDPSLPQETVTENVEAPVEHTDIQPVESIEPQIEHVETEVVPSATFHPGQAPVMEQVPPPIVETAGLYISQRPMVDVLNNVMGTGPTPFNFIQESELESPEVVAAPLPTHVPTALPIPTQTFTNTNFAAPPHVYQTIQDGPIAVVYPTNPAPQYIQAPPAPVPVPEPQRQYEPEQTASQQQTGATGGDGDWTENTAEQNDWAVAVEQSEQNRWSEPQTQNDEWNDNANDGFQPARGGGGRGRGRGGERGGRGGPRGNRGNSQNGRGGGYYNRNDGEGRGNYYQNGYGSRGGDRDRNEGGHRDRGEGGYREKGEGGYRGDREGGYRGGDRDGGYRGDREGGYKGDREGGYRGDREGGYRGDREGGYRGDREGGYRGRGGSRGGGQDRTGPRPERGGPRGGGGRGAPRGNRGGDRGRQ